MKRLFIGGLSLCCFMVLPVAAQENLFVSDVVGVINQTTFYDSDETPVNVTGQVRQVGGDQAAGVTIRFWQPDTPYNFVSTETDQQGRYDIELGPGLWSGEACASDNVTYLPAAWQVLIDGDRIKRLEAIQQKNIRIDSILIDGAQVTEFNRYGNVTLTLHGQGFGCSGSVRVVFSQSIDRCGDELPTEYDRDVIKIVNFDQRTDTLLRFQPPDLGEGDVQQNRVSLFYQQADQRSNALALTEHVLSDQFDDNAIICGGADVTEGNETSTGASTELVDDLGTVNTDVLNDNPAANGAYGDPNDNPASENYGEGMLMNFDVLEGEVVDVEDGEGHQASGGMIQQGVNLETLQEIDQLEVEGFELLEDFEFEGLNR